MNISEFSVKRPILIIVIFIAVTFLGLIGLSKLNYELLPKMDSPVLTIITPYPGAAPTEVENGVSKKIEEAVSGMPSLDVVRSISQQDISMVLVTLKIGADVDQALNEALRRIQSIKSDLPAMAYDPSVNKISVNEMPVFTMGVESDIPNSELYDLIEYFIKPRLTKIQGVGEIQVVGASPAEIQVNIDKNKLDNLGVSILQIVESVQKSNFDFPAGIIENQNGITSLRISGKFNSVSELSNHSVLQKPDGSIVKLKDIAEVISTEQEPKTIYHINGKQTIGLQITKNQDANTVKVIDEIKSELSKLGQEYKIINLEFRVSNDGSIVIKEAARGVARDLSYAILLVTAIMLLFLHSFRNALIIMVTVPLSLIATFIGISLLGYSLNLMTLLGLTVIIGTLVDDAIVVLENVYRHMEMGKSKWQATLDALKEVSLTVISTSLVLIVVFFPVALSESIISPIIEPFAMVVVISLIVSTLSALTLIPILTSRFSKLQINGGKNLLHRIFQFLEKMISGFSAKIIRILIWSLRRPGWTLLIATIMFFASFGLIGGGFIGSEFLSMGDVGEGIITLEYPANYTLKQNNIATRKIEAFISSKPEVMGIYTSVGKGSGIFNVQSGFDKTEIIVKLIGKKERDVTSSVFFKQLENELNSMFTDVKVRTGIITIMGVSDDAPIQIVFQGVDRDSLMLFASKMLKEVKKINGTNNVKLTIEGGIPEVLIRFDKEKMARIGVDPQVAGLTIQTSFSGFSKSKMQTGDFEYPINIRLDKYNRNSQEDVQNLTVINNMGQMIKLKQFANIIEVSGSSRVERYSRINSVVLESQVIGRSVGEVGNEILQLLEKTDMPNGIEYLPENELKFQADAFGTLGIALLIALVLVYLVMVALYNNYLHPLVVMFSIPLAVIGALFALALTRENLSIFSILGIIMLVGLVTKNAILVVDFINTLRSEKMRLTRAIITGVKLRIRPILMTAISTVIGMLPIALSQAPGSEWKNGLGWVLVGGITSSMLLSLVIVPVVYMVVERIKANFIFGKKE